jgi:hypothetical protein
VAANTSGSRHSQPPTLQSLISKVEPMHSAQLFKPQHGSAKFAIYCFPK